MVESVEEQKDISDCAVSVITISVNGVPTGQELSLAEGLHVEKRFFHATFATVSLMKQLITGCRFRLYDLVVRLSAQCNEYFARQTLTSL